MESKEWAPSRWSEQHSTRTRVHALVRAELELVDMLGRHAAMILAAEIRAKIAEALSRSALQARGVQLMG